MRNKSMPEISGLDKILCIVKVSCLLKEREKANIVIIEMQNVDSVRGSSLHME